MKAHAADEADTDVERADCADVNLIKKAATDFHLWRPVALGLLLKPRAMAEKE
jgi:hypothetical protein